MSTVKDEFKNTWTATIGVVTIDRRGEAQGIAVLAGDTVWLSQDEQILTANAPRKAEDNVLVNGKLVKVSEGKEIASRRPLAPEAVEPPAPVEPPAAPPAPAVTPDIAEVGTVVPPQPETETGTLRATEEVATPAAAEAPKPPAAKAAAPKPKPAAKPAAS